jgi:ribosome modulation factor
MKNLNIVAEEGRQSFEQGMPDSANPYDDAEAASAWRAGWLLAQSDHALAQRTFGQGLRRFVTSSS